MDGRRATSGFTLVELLITIGIMAVLLLLAVGPLQSFIHRGKIEGIARQTATLMQLARFEAIKRSVPAKVVVDTTTGSVFAFADVDRDDTFNAAVDRELGRYPLPNRVEFQSAGEAPNTDSALWNLEFGGLVFAEFNEDGSVSPNEAGDDDGMAPFLPAVRFGDYRENFVEVRVATAASGRIELRKWDGTAYRLQGEDGKSWVWH
jgi:prepilin-type N-terminal cleavage/methylation domain-containing protein